MSKKKRDIIVSIFFFPGEKKTCEEKPGYRGDAVGQVVLAGDAQQLVLRQLEAAEGTRRRLLLQLRRVRPPAHKMQLVFKRSKASAAERREKEAAQRAGRPTEPSPRSSSCTWG